MFDFNAYKGMAALAPMAGVGDSAFRQVCAKHGAAYTVSEMVSAKALHYGDTSTDELMYISDAERPCGIQLFGSEPDIMAEAVSKVCVHNPDFIDINMGCPVPKITGNGDGSALLKNPVLAGKIMEAVVKASPVPVSVKIRTGWNDEHIVAPEYVRIARESGISAIAIHGRTKAGGYSADVDYDTIAECVSVGGIFIVGNGGIYTKEDADTMFRKTGCDSVLVARGALGNPALFSEIKGLPPMTPEERLDVFIEQTRLAVAQKGEYIAIRQARTHAGFYFRGMRGAAALRKRGSLVSTLDELISVINEVKESCSKDLQ